MARKKNKGKFKVLEEIKNQLILQAERWGKKDHYTPLRLQEMELAACRKIKGDFLAEKANLEYEMQMLGTDKKEVLIKIEKLNMYISKSDFVIEQYQRKIERMLEKLCGDKKEVDRALKRVRESHKVSVM
ncbi:MAG: hypothetical protein KKH83_03395, partial [Candidatus Margulisbacteria bacterium]|nr:hypothetical protein [Candidatus Margulisiibacteriota bacterium]